ncbi:fungal-specific transcription factor domain-containing protein [Fimicolochytrium jonesii]|uniref:fungal-specific transcription factor domain-containing protein n=1 Tax=Fimicolochytrium jonesii TaxID=1396493 RepID=UPI0022FDED3A|nr:fungal-specific transcription factor domain-containing protein [Fimicolochytrium jonesii]KAI8822994.1 fungal-specific transcription factor domain-containing protein [Fimicolochytrium jonesii]
MEASPDIQPYNGGPPAERSPEASETGSHDHDNDHDHDSELDHHSGDDHSGDHSGEDHHNSHENTGGGSGDTRLPKRKRASKACDTCRKKRTKCSGDFPCSGCHAFGFECHYTESTKKRGPVKKNKMKTLEERLKKMETLIASASPEGDATIHEAPAQPKKKRSESSLGGGSGSNSKHHGPLTDGSIEPVARRSKLVNDPGCLVEDLGGNFVLYFGNICHAASLAQHSTRNSDGLLTLPLKFPARVADPSSPHHLIALREVLPLTHDQIIRLCSLYFDAVHPYVPLVDKDSFFSTLSDGPDSHAFRALLYSVLIVAAYHATALPNFTIDPVALDDLTRKVRDILIDYEAPHIWITQATLLLTLLWYGKGRRVVNKWRAVGWAIRSAQELGLHRNLSNIRNEEMRRRTWYWAYILDRYSSIGSGRPTLIQDEEWDVPYPQGYNDSERQNGDVEYMRQHADLCRIVGKLLRFTNAVRAPGSKKTASAKDTADDLHRDLEKWGEALPANLSWKAEHSEKVWSRRSILHATSHVCRLYIKRNVLGLHDSRSKAISLELIGILETLLTTAAFRPSTNLDTITKPESTTTSLPQSPSSGANTYVFPGLIISFFAAWDCHVSLYMAGDTDSMVHVERLHSIMETLEATFDIFTPVMMMMAHTLESKGIHTRLRRWAHRRAKGDAAFPADAKNAQSAPIPVPMSSGIPNGMFPSPVQQAYAASRVSPNTSAVAWTSNPNITAPYPRPQHNISSQSYQQIDPLATQQQAYPGLSNPAAMSYYATEPNAGAPVYAMLNPVPGANANGNVNVSQGVAAASANNPIGGNMVRSTFLDEDFLAAMFGEVADPSMFDFVGYV